MEEAIVSNVTSLWAYFGALGVPALVIGGVLLLKFFKGAGGGEKVTAARRALQKFTQKKSIEKIESIDRKQVKVVAEIKEHERMEPIIKEKIQHVMNRAADASERIAKMKNIKDVDDYIDSQWGNL